MSAHDQRINSALARAAAKHGYSQEAVTAHTPLDDLLDVEDAAAAGDTPRGAVLTRLLDFLMADGPHPGFVMRRVSAERDVVAAWLKRASAAIDGYEDAAPVVAGLRYYAAVSSECRVALQELEDARA